MKGTSRRDRGCGAGWADDGPASTTTRSAVRLPLVHRNDDQNEHQQRDDDQRRRDDDSRLPAGERVLDLARLRGDLCELVTLQRRHGARRAAKIDARTLGDRLDLAAIENA